MRSYSEASFGDPACRHSRRVEAGSGLVKERLMILTTPLSGSRVNRHSPTVLPSCIDPGLSTCTQLSAPPADSIVPLTEQEHTENTHTHTHLIRLV